jgi:hypothetical protein
MAIMQASRVDRLQSSLDSASARIQLLETRMDKNAATPLSPFVQADILDRLDACEEKAKRIQALLLQQQQQSEQVGLLQQLVMHRPVSCPC